MRSFKFSLFLLIAFAFLTLSVQEAAAQWWKPRSASRSSRSAQNAEPLDAPVLPEVKPATGTADRAGSGVTSRDTDRFLSYSEQKEKELEEEKKQKGLFIRFPWAKKEEKQTEELENPFGDVQLAPPRYQDLSELGIDTSKPAPGFETPAETASTHIPPVGAAPTAAFSNTPGTPAVHLPPVSPQAAAPVSPQAAAPVIPRSVAPQQGTVAVQDHSPTGISNPASGLTDPQSSNLHAGTGTFSGTLPAQLNVAPENSAVGTAVMLPSELPNSLPPAASPSGIPSTTPPTSSTSQPGVAPLNADGLPSASETGFQQDTVHFQADTVLTQVPSLMADSSELAGEGIQYYEHGQVLAQVGTQVILSGDIMVNVDRLMQEKKEEIPEEIWDLQREMLIRLFLQQSVEAKLIFCDVLRNVPAEGIKQNFTVIDKLFEEQELPNRMKKAGIQLREDYEKLLISEGTCIQKQKYLYREMVFCQQWLMKTIPQNPSVSYLEIADYYHAHPKEFEVPPQVRWEELVIRKARFHSRDEAYQEMVRIGSIAAMQKMPFAEVAQKFSHGVTASKGGIQDWIKPGELASQPLEDALFSQDVGVLSPQIIEDQNCFYVIRVLERVPLIRKPLGDVQKEIETKIRQNKITEAKEEYLRKLRREIPVFTVFDGIPSPEERYKAAQEAARAKRRASMY
ncbi:MAG: hypothetical protein E7029_08215 [Planctomycetaceae bacterium]|nr:hypothetical protein [Planctomycetaceae bacterium]